MKRVYLDQCHWIRLEAAALQRSNDVGALEALEVLRYGSGAGLVSVPLSAVHYMETYRRPRSRVTLAAVMGELSRYHAIAPPSAVVPAEIDAYLHARYGKPAMPTPIRVFGRGWAFAFSVRPGRFRLPDDADLPPGERTGHEDQINELVELAMLAGPPDGVSIPGWEENSAYREFGERQVEHERLLARALAGMGGASMTKTRDGVAATEVMDILEPLNEAFGRAGITRGESPELDSRDDLTHLLRGLPSRDVIFDLRRLRHADQRARWEPNDLEDLGALSIALPYCDVVVTEKQWRHLAEQAGIPDKYGTVVLDSLGDLSRRLV